jgi:hypothetical protein
MGALSVGQIFVDTLGVEAALVAVLLIWIAVVAIMAFFEG